MTRKLQNPTVDDAKSRKRILKPVVEKKRRDRINQSLAELRSLLLNHTSDARLQNPKIEKAEILDLAVEYLQKWTDGKTLSDDSTNSQTKTHASVVSLHHPESSPPLFTIQSAGFQQCMAQLTNYMHKITPAQRSSLIEGLKHHTETQQLISDFNLRVPGTACADAVSTSDTKDDSSKLLFPSHSPFQPQSCSTPCHDYLSPPSSPWFSPSFSTYASSPPFPSFASHFSFPPSLSPPSSNNSFFSFSPTAPHTGPPGLHFPPATSLRSSPHLAPREASQPNSSSTMWRPWF
ncbi:transcription factor HES-7-like [Solea senegalensis]|uniref:Transcription factor HES-7-like n=1 Tax=Solea senegalensis TaxID=28829 RepID=A0AAV6SNF9_SOLSE|nr:hairy-related 11 [Solea senegalensis]KAG7517872.1 transcription factor HES-7-like [Solea senegalensis]